MSATSFFETFQNYIGECYAKLKWHELNSTSINSGVYWIKLAKNFIRGGFEGDVGIIPSDPTGSTEDTSGKITIISGDYTVSIATTTFVMHGVVGTLDRQSSFSIGSESAEDIDLSGVDDIGDDLRFTAVLGVENVTQAASSSGAPSPTPTFNYSVKKSRLSAGAFEVRSFLDKNKALESVENYYKDSFIPLYLLEVRKTDGVSILDRIAPTAFLEPLSDDELISDLFSGINSTEDRLLSFNYSTFFREALSGFETQLRNETGKDIYNYTSDLERDATQFNKVSENFRKLYYDIYGKNIPKLVAINIGGSSGAEVNPYYSNSSVSIGVIPDKSIPTNDYGTVVVYPMSNTGYRVKNTLNYPEQGGTNYFIDFYEDISGFSGGGKIAVVEQGRVIAVFDYSTIPNNNRRLQIDSKKFPTSGDIFIPANCMIYNCPSVQLSIPTGSASLSVHTVTGNYSGFAWIEATRVSAAGEKYKALIF